MWLYDGSGTNQLAYNDDGGSTSLSSKITYTIYQAGTYYAKVDQYYNQAMIADYSLSLQASAPPPTATITQTSTVTPVVSPTPTFTITRTRTVTPVVSPTPTVTVTPTPQLDVYEPDNVPAQASTMAINTTQFHHSIVPVTDFDWIRFEVQVVPNPIVIETNGPVMGDTRMWLYDGTGTALLAYNDDTNGLWSRISYTITQVGQYYIKLDEYNNNHLIADYNVVLSGLSITTTPTCSPTISATSTISATFTSTRTVTPTYTESATFTVTPTVTPTSTVTPTYTETPTFTVTPTVTPTFTITETSTVTPTFTESPTFTATSTITPTYTETPTFTDTPTVTPTRTITKTSTETPTFTDTPTVTPTSSRTLTFTPVSTRTPVRLTTLTCTVTTTPTVRSSWIKDIVAYPNPARNINTINFAWEDPGVDRAMVRIYNFSGELVATLQQPNPGQKITWQLNGIAPGIYVYEAVLEKGGKEYKRKLSKIAIIK